MNHKFTPRTIHCLNPNLVCYEIEQAEIPAKKVGIMDLIFVDNGETIYLDYIEIKDDFRGLGIGTEIILKLINFCKKFGSKKIILRVDANNEGAQKLYKRLGFKFLPEIDPEFFCYAMEYII